MRERAKNKLENKPIQWSMSFGGQSSAVMSDVIVSLYEVCHADLCWAVILHPEITCSTCFCSSARACRKLISASSAEQHGIAFSSRLCHAVHLSVTLRSGYAEKQRVKLQLHSPTHSYWELPSKPAV